MKILMTISEELVMDLSTEEDWWWDLQESVEEEELYSEALTPPMKPDSLEQTSSPKTPHNDSVTPNRAVRRPGLRPRPIPRQ